MWVASFFAFLGIFLIIPLLIAIAIYVLMAIGLSTLAANAGIENPWLAWIPIANLYILGKLIPKLSISSYVIPNHELVLPCATIVAIILGSLPFIGMLISLANFVLLIFAVYNLFKRYTKDSALIYTIVGFVTCGIMVSVFIYMIRNEKPIA